MCLQVTATRELPSVAAMLKALTPSVALYTVTTVAKYEASNLQQYNIHCK